MRAAFYCVSSRVYFLGAVGLINSLRLVGHAEPVHVLDCGLDEWQRELVRGEVTLVPAQQTTGDTEPFLLKTRAPMTHPADAMILIDADMIVTRPLTDLIRRGAEGGVVAFRNDTDRFVPEWGDLLGLGHARRLPYLSSGLVVLGGKEGASVLRLVDEAQRRARFDFSIDIRSKNPPRHPFLYLDQDVLNAVVCTSVDREQIVDLDSRLAPNQPFRGLRLEDERTLCCSYPDGVEPYVLHQYLAKPWLEPMYHGIYSRLLARLLLGSDVAIRVPEERVPLRMRRGLLARLERKRVDVQDLVRWYARDVVPEWVSGRLGALRGGRAPRRTR
jgi:hypothetical protein